MPATLLAFFFVAVFALCSAAILIGRRYLAARAHRPEGSVVRAVRCSPQAATVPAEEEDDSDWLTSLQAPNLLKEEQLSTISFWDSILARFDGIEILKMRIAEAGLKWSVGRVTTMMLLAGASTFVILTRMDWIPHYGAALAAFAAAAAPYLMILRRRARRLSKFEAQFPDALDTLARALRAGNTLAAAFEVLAREGKPPLSSEIRKTVDERNLGLPWDQALENLSERVPILEVSMFVATIQLQTRTGGRLHEVLMKLSESMREAVALKGEVRAITAHGRLTGLLLTVLPVAIAATMSYVNPDHLMSLWRHPAGKDMIIAAVVCLITAHLVIRKMVDIRV